MAYFPMFIDIYDKKCLIIGGGKIALQKVKVLLDFDANITIIAKECLEELYAYPVKIINRALEKEDVLSYFLVICATDDKVLNHEISMYCKEHNILVNVVDQKEDCTFIFPSYIKEKEVVAAFSSSGNSPVLTQYLREKNREWITPVLGEINDYFKSIREMTKQEFAYNVRRNVNKEILEKCLEKEDILTQEELDILLEKYR